MLEDLLQKKVIELPECKRPKEIGYVNDLSYYHYHLIISHSVEKCFILKDLIMKRAKQGRIHLDLDEVIESNHAIVLFNVSHKNQSKHKCYVGITFFAFALIMNQCHLMKKVGHW